MKKRLLLSILITVVATVNAWAQFPSDSYNGMSADGSLNRRNRENADTLGTDKEIPRGIRVWTVDGKFGDIRKAEPDTLSYLFPNSIFTTGRYGEYNTTGNLGAPRINRIFIDRNNEGAFIFTHPYDFFVKQPEEFHFTNTLSPITNLTYNSAGNRTNGENHLSAKFAVNAGKRIGAGFLFDYLYGRGYYDSQSTSLFNYSMFGSYLGERYQAHLLVTTNHQKVTENGGITNDFYITHPESFDDDYQTSEIPTVLSRNWNRNDNQHVFLTHRYNVGFKRKIPMTEEEIEARKFAIESKKQSDAKKAKERAEREAEENGDDFDESNYKEEPSYGGRPDNAAIAGTEPADTTRNTTERIAVNGKEIADSLMKTKENVAEVDTTWMKDEYVPVTSFIHTLHFSNYKRIYQAYTSPTDYYADTFFGANSDSIYDRTRHYQLQNTFAISLLEGFNKWAKAGLKAFVCSDLQHYTLPDEEQFEVGYNEKSLSIGGQIDKQEGHTLHYTLTAESWILGDNKGELFIDADADLNFRLFGDTVTLSANAYMHREEPTFYYRNYHSKHLWWDNTLDFQTHSHIEGNLTYQKTKTSLRVAVDNIDKYTYFAGNYTITDSYGRNENTVAVRQAGSPINVLTASLRQDFKLGPLHWDNIITYQKSSDNEALPLPDLNIYTNLYLRFKIARVLHCDLGVDARYFTKYHAPDYSPILGQFVTQEYDQKTDIGDYPIVNAYANFCLKGTRFFVLYSHANAGSGNRNYFLTPHYPLNESILRLGISWNFFN